MLADLASADPVAAMFSFLTGAGAGEVEAILGGPAHLHVSGELEPGWPHVMLTSGPGGDLRSLLWDTEHEVQVEVYGSPAGMPGEAELWAATMRVAQLLCDMPERDAGPGEAVVSRVRPSGALAFQKLPSGHPRCTLGLLVVIHPPN